MRKIKLIKMNKKVIIYQTLERKEIFRDWECLFIPFKGQFVSFKETDEKLCNLMPHEKQLEYAVIRITILLPSVVLVTVS